MSGFLRQGRVRSLPLFGLLLLACATSRPPQPRPAPAPPVQDFEARHPCDPIGSVEPLPSDGGVCGDGVRGQRCELHRVNACGTFSESVSCSAPELCEANDLGGATCASIGLSGAGLACAPGCQFFDDRRCDACPRRPGVQCQPLGLAKSVQPHTFAVSPGGAVAVLSVDDAMKTRLFISQAGRLIKTLTPLANHDPRHLVALDSGRFAYVVEEYEKGVARRIVVVPFSARDGLGKPISLLEAQDVRVQATDVVDGVPLVVSFTAGPAPAWDVHALSPKGMSMPLPEGRVLVAFLRFTPELAIRRDASGTTVVVSLPNNGGACRASVVTRGPDGAVRPAFGPEQLGTITESEEGARCRATWKHPDGAVTTLGQRPPPMQGVEDWKRAGAMWLGERQGVLLTVDPLEFR